MKYQRKSDGVIANIFHEHFYGKGEFYRAIIIEEEKTGKMIMTVVKGMIDLNEKQLKQEWEKINA